MKTQKSILAKVLRPIHKLYLRAEKHENKNVQYQNGALTEKKTFCLDNDVSEIMTARVDVTAIEISTKFSDVIEIIAKSGYSRIPIYEKELDQIKGVLYVKDLFKYLNHKDFDWTKVIREPFFVPENKNINDLLQEFQDTKRHQAIVVDEFGSFVGIVSLEDILEEIVGEIMDEFDFFKPSLSTKLDDYSYIFAGKISINDFCKAINLSDDTIFDEIKGDADTLAGMMIEIAGHLPIKGETLRFNNYNFIIEKADNRKIERIKLIIE
ncbi:MAG: magnesium/cobalt efflux protein [Bacteroidetes bacterium]|nr:magnesium/cobalt efflux protein [Bacteroidota bacterium]